MIESFGIERNNVARWAGITTASFSLSQSAFAIPWGRASDHFGRKPTVVFGLFSTMICFVAWGLASSLPMAIGIRILAGVSNGNVGIIRTMVAEMVPWKELQPRAFSLMPMVWALGSIFGPSIGGYFANPTQRFPSVFGGNRFFATFPYALPSFLAAVFFLFSLAAAILFLRETLDSKKHHEDWGLVMGRRLTRPFSRRERTRIRRTSFVDGEATAPLLPSKLKAVGDLGEGEGEGESEGDRGQGGETREVAKPRSATMKEVFNPQSINWLVAYFFLALHSISYDQVLPVFLHHPVNRDINGPDSHLPFQFIGGFGLESGQIGTIYTLYGITCGLTQFIVFPPICSLFGILNSLRFTAISFPIILFLTPFTVLIEDDSLRWFAVLAMLSLKGFVCTIAFPCVTILLTNSATSTRTLGTLNGFAVMFSGLGRAFGPALAGAAFSWGLKHGYVVTAWFLLAFISAVGAIPTFLMGDPDGLEVPAGNEDENENEDEDEYENEYECDASSSATSTVVVPESAVASDSDEDDDEPYDERPLRARREGATYGTV